MSQPTEMDNALAELEAWASEDTLPDQNQPMQTAAKIQQTRENAPCLPQHQTRELFDLLQSVKGCPLPEAMMPQMPR